MPVDSIILAAGAVLYGGVAYYNPVSRAERLYKKVQETQGTNRESMSIMKASGLQTEQAQTIFSNTETQQRNVVRIKARVRGLKQKIMDAPLHKRILPGSFNGPLAQLEIPLRSYFRDAVNTSIVVSTIASDKSLLHHTDEELIYLLKSMVSPCQSTNSQISVNDPVSRSARSMEIQPINEEQEAWME